MNKMTKKAVTKVEPIISTIPMPVSDNPVVIDLPDGQKLVLGKLNAGSVIEVATWRGTGRPDSRTNRMMLGMTDGTAPISNAPSAENAPATRSTKKFSLPFGSIVPSAVVEGIRAIGNKSRANAIIVKVISTVPESSLARGVCL